jgi:hypothetical protein
VTREHGVARAETVFTAHDSVAEITRLVIRFLVDLFGDSTVSPDDAVVDFTDTCRGKEEERQDVIANRAERLLLSSTATVTDIEFNAEKTFAWITAPCEFRDIDLSDGREYIVTGRCELTARYEPDRWWLCESYFRDGSSRPAGGRHTPPAGSGRYWDYAR